jgi:hypothetical protein
MATPPRPVAPQTDSAVAQTAHLQASGQKQIAGTVIFSRFINCLGLQPDVDLTEPLTTIMSGGLTNWDLGLDLMDYGPFKTDGLILEKLAVMNEVNVGGLCNLVFAWYRSDGWTVT